MIGDFLIYLWDIVLYVLAIFFLFLILVSVHEYGHFVAARKLGVKVLRFSIGFGKPILKWTSARDTEFVLATIPFGGYLSMLDTRNQEDVAPEDEPQAFDKVTPWRQIVIAAAGPFANLVLAAAIFWVFGLLGSTEVVPYVGQIEEDSPAYVAELPSGAEVVAVDGEPVQTWFEFNAAALRRMGESGSITITTQADELTQEFQLPIENFLRGANPDVFAGLGFQMGWLPVINTVMPDSAADHAGILPGDHILYIDDTQITVWDDLTQVIQSSADQEVSIRVLRDGLTHTLTAVPRLNVNPDGSTSGILGVTPRLLEREVQYGLFGSFSFAIKETWDFTVLTISSIGKMLTRQVDTSNLAGPVSIGQMAGEVAHQGLEVYFRLVAMLSISLFLINLLPIPILDGGHIVYALIQMVIGRPVPVVVQRFASIVGIVLLGSLFIYVLFNDITRIWFS